MGRIDPGSDVDLLEKRLLVISGKGGVGKTVVSSALAVLAAKQGKRVLLVKLDDQGRTQQLFETDHELGDQITPLDAEGRISGINLDPKTVVADYFRRQLKIRRIAEHIVNSRLFEAWFRVSPAIKEMILLGKVWSLVEERTRWTKKQVWDLVVFDAPATGHGLGYLRLPEQASKLLIGPMRTNALAVGSMLANTKTTGVLVVTIPEEMPVNEAIHFVDEARGGINVHLSGLVLNAAFPQRFAPAQLEQVEVLAGSAPGQAVGAVVGGSAEALLEAARYSAQRGALTERYRDQLRERVDDVPLFEVPYVFAERFGRAQLEQVAGHLAAAFGVEVPR